MAQFKIYGHASFLKSRSRAISAAIQRAAVSALGLPESKTFHRFLPLEPWQFVTPADRSERYIIIEVMMFEGRPEETVRAFYRDLSINLETDCQITPQDVELVITESPRRNWLIRGMAGDDLELNYRVDHRAD